MTTLLNQRNEEKSCLIFLFLLTKNTHLQKEVVENVREIENQFGLLHN